MKHFAYISIGSNLGDRVHNCANAILQLSNFSELIKHSSFYETESWGYDDVNLYINCVVKISTQLNPGTLLSQLKLIEKTLGRSHKKNGNLYESRIIDLDILFFDNLILNNSELNIPHKHLYNRNYVLIPFAEIDPDFVCPLKKHKISHILSSCKDKSQVALYTH
tara:strand:+ start:358 stop:852 length:495 start_codon:yes stop_codon:yes gene_type:complete